MADTKIVLVEVDPTRINRFSAMLTQNGYIVFVAASQKECFLLIGLHRPHMLLVNESILDGDTLECCKHLRADFTKQSLAILLFLSLSK